MIASQFAGSGYTPAVVAPTGAPTSASMYSYGGGLIGLQWTNGDPLAETEVGFRLDNTRTLEPTSVLTKVSPGVTGYETGETAGENTTCTWWIRHKRGGSTTAWVIVALGPFECGELL